MNEVFGAGAMSRLSPALFDGGALLGDRTASGDKLAVEDPATGEILGHVACLQIDDVDRAVATAADAFLGWRAMLPIERGHILRRWADNMRRNSEDLAILMTLEQGKPLNESRAEIDYAKGFLEWFAAEGERAYGDVIPSHKPGSLLHVRSQPIGVAAAVTPWNFPSAMITRKAGAALAAGCPMIVVPAMETPFSALAVARLGLEAGLPPGVLQVLTGEPKTLVGGWKQSGLGREGSRHGLAEYMELKYVCFGDLAA